MFFTHFASKNQLHGFSVSATLAENGLIQDLIIAPSVCNEIVKEWLVNGVAGFLAHLKK